VKVAAAELKSLARAPETAVRCRKLAEERFSLDEGVHRYLSVYTMMLK
jgi:hypothetical protein